jgi:hypothetical protein
MLPLPAMPFEASDKVTARVSSIALVRYRTNDYSVPTQYGHGEVLVKGYVHRVGIVCGAEAIARHETPLNAPRGRRDFSAMLQSPFSPNTAQAAKRQQRVQAIVAS